jgi:hypothetical protein
MFNDAPFKLRDRSAAICAAFGVASAIAVGGVMVAPTVAHADATSCSLSQMSSSSQPACWHPFSGGAFNTELSATPELAPNSAAVVSHMTSYDWTIGNGSGFSLGAGSRPVFFASASDPEMNIVCTNAEGAGSCTGANGVNVGGQTIRVPAGLSAASNTDGHLTVIEANGDEYDFWEASISGSTLSAGTGSVVNANTGDGLGGQGDAANFALTAGLLRPSELASGVINHALVVTVPCTDANGASVGYSYPATGGWGETCGDYWNESPTGAPLLGQLLRLNMSDAQIAASPAPAWQKTIMTALAHYGAYIEDTDGTYDAGVDVITQDSDSWTDLGETDQWAALATQYGDANGQLSSNAPIPVSDMQVVNACVALARCPASVDDSSTTSTSSTTATPSAATVAKSNAIVATAATVADTALPIAPTTKTTTTKSTTTKTKATTAGSTTSTATHHKHHKAAAHKKSNKKAKHHSKRNQTTRHHHKS